jgi:hypothetical protein
MNKEDLRVLPLALVGLATGLGEYYIKQPVVNAGRVAMHIVFGGKEQYDHPISANITYYGSPESLEDDRANLPGVS